MKLTDIFRLILSIAVCFLAGAIGSVFTYPNMPTWYANLNKPFFNPPNWIFGPVWTILYIMMGIALFLVWQKSIEDKAARPLLPLFLLQLALNSLWSIIFFGEHLLLWASIEIIILWCVILLFIIRSYRISKPASWLMVPYICWVSFAAILTISLKLLN
ncbi:MAG: tryptophan-rich sensory protein [Candidatus Saganbacteria bacterium]|nr:tryptophan-rich sensory protein [Candidatus Saganbacteria bacterium]